MAPAAGWGGQSGASPRPAPLEEETGGPATSGAAAGGPGDGGLSRDPAPQVQTIFLLQDIEVGETTLQKLESEYNQRKHSVQTLQSTSTELDKRKIDLLGEIQLLHQRSKNEGPQDAVERLMLVLEVLKELGAKLRGILSLKRN